MQNSRGLFTTANEVEQDLILLQLEGICSSCMVFLDSFLAANCQTAIINACEVNTPWMINVLRYAFFPCSGLKGDQGFIYSRITNSTTVNELTVNCHIHMNDN